MKDKKREISALVGERYILIFFYCLFFSFIMQSEAESVETVIIPVQFRNAAEILPLVKNILSKDGKVSIDVRTNSLILTDNEESIHKVREFLSAYDKAVKQVRIRLEFEEMGSYGDRSLSMEGKISGKGWEVAKGKKRRNGGEVDIKDNRQDRRQSSEYFIHVMSGSWAYILVGKEIPYVDRWTDLCKRYAHCVGGRVVFQRIETGMKVRPTIVGNQAHIEIMPRISHEVSRGQIEIIRFTEASTELTVPLGEWVNIGGMDEKRNEVIKAILESGRGEKRVSLLMALMVETY